MKQIQFCIWICPLPIPRKELSGIACYRMLLHLFAASLPPLYSLSSRGSAQKIKGWGGWGLILWFVLLPSGDILLLFRNQIRTDRTREAESQDNATINWLSITKRNSDSARPSAFIANRAHWNNMSRVPRFAQRSLQVILKVMVCSQLLVLSTHPEC